MHTYPFLKSLWTLLVFEMILISHQLVLISWKRHFLFFTVVNEHTWWDISNSSSQLLDQASGRFFHIQITYIVAITVHIHNILGWWEIKKCGGWGQSVKKSISTFTGRQTQVSSNCSLRDEVTTSLSKFCSSLWCEGEKKSHYLQQMHIMFSPLRSPAPTCTGLAC